MKMNGAGGIMETELTIKDIQKSNEVKALLQAAGIQMDSLGYTEHTFRH